MITSQWSYYTVQFTGYEPAIPSLQITPTFAPAQESPIHILWRLFRPHTLTASFIPVLIGTALAWNATGQVRCGVFVAMMLASVLIQAATNMFNEYFDYMSGLDTAESVGIAGAITNDNVPPRAILLTAIGTLGVAVLLGVYICAQSSWWLACIGVVCMLVGYLYAGGPYPISATPFGELFAGLFMGTGITLIACLIQRRTMCVRDVLVSIPSALLIGAILTSNNIRDLEQDRKNGRRTLAILLGHKWAVRFLACTLLLANLWVVFLVARGVASSWLLLVLGSLGLAAGAIRHFQGEATVPGMMLGMKRVAQTNTLFGLLLVLGLILGR